MQDEKFKTSLIKARITDDKKEKLKEYCVKNDTTVSKVISDCIDKILSSK